MRFLQQGQNASGQVPLVFRVAGMAFPFLSRAIIITCFLVKHQKGFFFVFITEGFVVDSHT